MPLASKDISSPKTLERSILNDPQVYPWFAFLVLKTAAKKRLLGIPELKSPYQKLSLILTAESLLYVCLLALLAGVAVSGKYLYLWLGVFFLSGLVLLHYPKKRAVATLGMHLLSLDFDETSLRRTTLYQITEHYSRQFSIPSLIDYIVVLDRISQVTIVASLVFFLFLKPMPVTFKQALVMMAGLLLIVNAFSKTLVFYTLKK